MLCAWLLNPHSLENSCEAPHLVMTLRNNLSYHAQPWCSHLHLPFPKTFHYEQLILIDLLSLIALNWDFTYSKGWLKVQQLICLGSPKDFWKRIFLIHTSNSHCKSIVPTYFSGLTSKGEEVWLALARGNRFEALAAGT